MCADPGEHGYGLSKLNTEARYNRSTQNNCFELFPRAWHFSRSAFSPCTHSAAEATTFGLCRWTPLTSFLRTCSIVSPDIIRASSSAHRHSWGPGNALMRRIRIDWPRYFTLRTTRIRFVLVAVKKAPRK